MYRNMTGNQTPKIMSYNGSSHTLTTVNWDYWSKLPTWRAVEAAALLSGTDPDIKTTETLEALRLRRWLIRASKAGEI